MISVQSISKTVPAVKYGLAGAVCTVIIAWLFAMFHTEYLTTRAVHPSIQRIYYRWVEPLVHGGGAYGIWPADDTYCWQLGYQTHYMPGVQVIETVYPTYDQNVVPLLNKSMPIATQPPSWSMASKPPRQPLILGAIEQATGFPFLAMYGAQVKMEEGEAITFWDIDESEPRWAIELPYEHRAMELTRHRILPLKPIWRGFVLDTLVWGFVCYVIHILSKRIWKFLIIPFRVRANIAQGKCRKLRCGYPVAGFSKCPECGTVVKNKKPKNAQTL